VSADKAFRGQFSAVDGCFHAGVGPGPHARAPHHRRGAVVPLPVRDQGADLGVWFERVTDRQRPRQASDGPDDGVGAAARRQDAVPSQQIWPLLSRVAPKNGQRCA
jgi:hypothetical protein